MCHENRERKANKAAAKVGPLLDESLSLPFFGKECALPKKKRQKCADRSSASSSITTAGGQTTAAAEMEEAERRRSKAKGLPLYALPTKVKHEYVLADYSVDLHDETACQTQEGDASSGDTTPPRLILKKISKKSLKQSSQHSPPCLPALSAFEDSAKAGRYAFEIVEKQSLLDVESNGELESVGSHPVKPAASSTNYDDAMQFVKKKRYLQAAMASNSRDYSLNTSVSSQTPVTQSVVSTVIDETVPATILEPQPISTAEIKTIHDKGVLPDEVLQTLLDHYSNKANGQSDISFSVADTEVTSSISINSSDVSDSSPSETLGASSAQAPPSGEKVSLLQEYSKFLQQALERTSQNDSYLTSQSLSLVSENPTLAGQPLFSTEKQFPSPSRFKSGSSPLRTTIEKSHFGLLVGDSQHSFSFSGDESTPPSEVSPAEDDFLEQVSPSKKNESPQGLLQTFQINSFDQNFKSHFPPSRSGSSSSSSQFAVANGQLGLRGHSTDFSEFPLVRVTETRSQLNSSPDVSSSETFG